MVHGSSTRPEITTRRVATLIKDMHVQLFWWSFDGIDGRFRLGNI